MRLTIVALASVLAMSAVPAFADGPYSLDGNGKCHDASGKFAKKEFCAPPKHCRDPKTGKFAKCAVPTVLPN